MGAPATGTYISIEHLDAGLVEQLHELAQTDLLAWAWLAALFADRAGQRPVSEVRERLMAALAGAEPTAFASTDPELLRQVAGTSPERQRDSRRRALRFLDERLAPARS